MEQAITKYHTQLSEAGHPPVYGYEIVGTSANGTNTHYGWVMRQLDYPFFWAVSIRRPCYPYTGEGRLIDTYFVPMPSGATMTLRNAVEWLLATKGITPLGGTIKTKYQRGHS